ncbi:putative low molecular weight protein-tyrosine-phosphatase [Sesamum alatum]|uniref:acid phosphatase n=1 Tax=Sesamum alatum TaxID=300844 RepID=A0AAE2D0F5_9LAMI|nr:putative low molecular weight protein-tyrosine-phosphatase [Sesamum alatum]
MSSSKRPFSILFVCYGNICRSPAAEAVFIHLVNQKNLHSKFRIDSAGTAHYLPGTEPDPRMAAASKKRGIEITSTSRQLKPSDIWDFDLILAMDQRDLDNIDRAVHCTWAVRQNLPTNPTKNVKLICSYCKKHKLTELPNPYFHGPHGFDKALDVLEDACESVLESIIEKEKLLG